MLLTKSPFDYYLDMTCHLNSIQQAPYVNGWVYQVDAQELIFGCTMSMDTTRASDPTCGWLISTPTIRRSIGPVHQWPQPMQLTLGIEHCNVVTAVKGASTAPQA